MTIIAQDGIDWSGSFQQTFDGFFSFVPSLIGALAILLIGWFIAKLIFRLLAALLKRVGFDSLVDRSGLGGPLERAGFPDAGVFLAKVIYWLLMVVVISLAVDVLGIEALQNLVDDLANWLPKLFVALLLLFVTGAAANFVRNLLNGTLASQSWGTAAATAAFAGIWFIGGTAALDQAQIAGGIVDQLFETVMWSLGGILIIKYGIGGIWAARDRFWPAVYNKVSDNT